jgi:hypothetical protein
MMAIHVAEIPPGLDNVSHPTLELFRLGEPAVDRPVPEHAALYRRRGRPGCRGRLMEDLDHEDAARAGLQGDFAEGCRKRREELLGKLFFGSGGGVVSFLSLESGRNAKRHGDTRELLKKHHLVVKHNPRISHTPERLPRPAEALTPSTTTLLRGTCRNQSTLT